MENPTLGRDIIRHLLRMQKEVFTHFANGPLKWLPSAWELRQFVFLWGILCGMLSE
jgi:hypothetical protein